VTIASAAQPAAPFHPFPAAARSFEQTDSDSGSGAQFASQLRGITQSSNDDGETAVSATKPTVQPAPAPAKPTVQQAATVLPAQIFDQPPAVTAAAISLPRPATRPVEVQRLAPSTAKRSVSSQSSAPKLSAESNPIETTAAVVTTPALEIAALPGSDGDSINGDDSDSAVKLAGSHGAPEEVAEPAPPAVTTTAGPAQAAQEMAFAARVQPVESANGSSLPAEMASASAVASASKKIETAGQDETALPMDTHGLVAAAAAMERNAEPAATAAPAAQSTPTAHRMEAPSPATETATKPSTPLKDISLQVNQPGKERVEVRVVQQGGEVHVSVHSGDASLNSGLRQGLSELQSRLEETGYRSEVWRPGTATLPVAAAPSAQASTNQSRQGDGQPQQQGGSQQDGGRRNPNQSNQPRWVEELESSLGAGEKSTGGFYGFTS